MDATIASPKVEHPMNKRSKNKTQIAAHPHDKSHKFSPTPRIAVPQQGPANRTTTTWNEAEYVSRQTQEIDLSQFQQKPPVNFFQLFTLLKRVEKKI